MKIFNLKEKLSEHIDELKNSNASIGFVPTMGALHNGHLSLINRALDENDIAVVSIFVNPTQFDNNSDLKNYPRDLDSDLDKLKAYNNKIIVYAPQVEDIYPKSIEAQKFDFDGLENQMEGKFRQGHFDGVGTIVKYLFEIVRPNNAYFGEKDFQQLQIIKKLTLKHQIPVNIIGCPIFREKDGLAMSSRNQRLKPEYRKAAPFIYKTLASAKKMFGTKSANRVTEWVVDQFSSHELLDLEYFIIADEETLSSVKRKSKNKKYRAFIAVYADEIRLIDNLALN